MTGSTPSPAAREAHVQVLTAEVRTLVVGSRQVTMSVYSQLDNVPPGEIEPIGRVGVDDRLRFITVIGREVSTGALARSYVPRRPESMRDNGWVPTVTNTVRKYSHWNEGEDAEQQRKHLAEVAACWAVLPLIVLAGLR